MSRRRLNVSSRMSRSHWDILEDTVRYAPERRGVTLRVMLRLNSDAAPPYRVKYARVDGVWALIAIIRRAA
jgi:hypothetical protein